MPIYRDILSDLCEPSRRTINLRVTPTAQRAIRNGHPWVFDQAIIRQNREGRPGDLAVIYDDKNRFLALGLYDPGSPIPVRILHQGQPTVIDQDWFGARLADAVQQRASLATTRTTGYRLVHGENDKLPGLVVDRYDQTIVIKLDTTAWIAHLRCVLAALTSVIPAQRIVLRLSRSVLEKPEHLHNLRDGSVLSGPPLEGPVPFLEHGLQFEADLVNGQKTGFFLDQRDNRARIEKLTAQATVLNVFAYTGGFSLYAARGGAQRIVSLDISRPALAVAARHFDLNRDDRNVAAANHELLCADAFEALSELANERRRFDVIMLDPPSFARKQVQVDKALAAYERLARLSLRVLHTGGIIALASCSSRVSADRFFAAVHQAAKRANRPLSEIERTGHPLDHPIGFKEGAYLKCLFARA